MDFGSLMFLSSRIMHHLLIQLNTNTGYRVQLREHLGTAPSGRNRQRREQRGRKGGERDGSRQSNGQIWLCVYVCHFKDGPLGRPSLRTCQFVSSLIAPFCVSLWRAAFRFLLCFDSVTWADCQAVYLNDDWWCLLNYGKAQTWSMAGPLRRNPSWTWVCPCPGCLGYLQVVKCDSPREGVKSRV